MREELITVPDVPEHYCMQEKYCWVVGWNAAIDYISQTLKYQIND